MFAETAARWGARAGSQSIVGISSWRSHGSAIRQANSGESTNGTRGCSYMYAVHRAFLSVHNPFEQELTNWQHPALHANALHQVAQGPATAPDPFHDSHSLAIPKQYTAPAYIFSASRYAEEELFRIGGNPWRINERRLKHFDLLRRWYLTTIN